MKFSFRWAKDHRDRSLGFVDMLINDEYITAVNENEDHEKVVPLKAYVASYGQYSDNTILAVCSTAEAAQAACQKHFNHEQAELDRKPVPLSWFNWKDEPTPAFEGGYLWDRPVTQNTAVEGDYYVEVFNYE